MSGAELGAASGGAYALRPDVVVTVVEEGAVLLDLESKYFYSANAGAWQAIGPFETGASFEQVRALCAGLGAGPDDLAALDALFAQLLEEGLIEPADACGDAVPCAEGGWSRPVLEKHREPLQRVMSSAFDPSIPLAE